MTSSLSEESFIKEFEASLAKISEINDIIEQHNRKKKEDSQLIIEKLEAINRTINEIVTKISELKFEVVTFQENVKINTQSITDKDQEIQNLKDEKNRLESEKNTMISTLEQSIREKDEEISKRTREIENLINEITLKNAEIDSLKNDLSNIGDNGATHAAEIAAKTAEIYALNKQIQDLKQENNQDSEENNKLKEEFETKATDFTNKIAELENQISAKDTEIIKLREDNQELIQRIIAATQAINDATVSLEKIDNDQTDINKITTLLDTLEKSLQQISNIIQGTSSKESVVPGFLGLGGLFGEPGSEAGVFPALSRTNSEAGSEEGPTSGSIIKDNIKVNVDGKEMTIGDLKKKLLLKSNQMTKPNKYQEAYDKVNAINVNENKENIDKIIKNLGLLLTQDGQNIKGGKNKKTKNKNTKKKQTGGFIYKAHSKRRNIKSTSYSSKPKKFRLTSRRKTSSGRSSSGRNNSNS